MGIRPEKAMAAMLSTFLVSVLLSASWASPVITSIYPTDAPSTGGQEVTVFGENFAVDANIKCKFGSSVVAATVVNDSAVTCTTPAHVRGQDEVRASNDGQVWSPMGYPFFFYDAPGQPRFQKFGRGSLQIRTKHGQKPVVPLESDAVQEEIDDLVVSWMPPKDDGGHALDNYRLEISYDEGANWDTMFEGNSATTVVPVKGNRDCLFRLSAANPAGYGKAASITHKWA